MKNSSTPSPGRVTRFEAPGGPGVRMDAGYQAGDTVSQYYDNLLGKLVVWGEDREAARHRALRALAETHIEGVATTIPADVAILTHPDFIEVRHSTNWVEERLDLSGIESPGAVAAGGEEAVLEPRDVTAEVAGRRYQVKLWLPDTGPGTVAAAPAARAGAPKRRAAHAVGAGTGSGSVTVPMQGTIVKVLVGVGDAVESGQTICVLEAMKMENAINAEKSGVVTEIRVAAGDPVGSGDVVAVIE